MPSSSPANTSSSSGRPSCSCSTGQSGQQGEAVGARQVEEKPAPVCSCGLLHAQPQDDRRGPGVRTTAQCCLLLSSTTGQLGLTGHNTQPACFRCVCF